MTDRLDRIESQLEALTTAVSNYIEHNENERRETNVMLQSFIDEGKADRAESQRFRLAFTEAMQSMVAQLVSRINEIWERINAA